MREGSHLRKRMNYASIESLLVPCQFEERGGWWVRRYDGWDMFIKHNGA